METTSLLLPLLLLLLIAASCSAQGEPQFPPPPPPPPQGQPVPALGIEGCSRQGDTVTCVCRPGQEALQLAGAFDGAEALEVRGCAAVSLAPSPLQQQRLLSLSVSDCASATFQQMMPPLLRHLALRNVSQVVFQGAVFHATDLETLLLDRVHVSTLPSGVFTNLTKIQNVTFQDLSVDAVESGAVAFRMAHNSELTILHSTLLGIETAGIVVKGVDKFTMQDSKMTTVGDNGLQLDILGAASISGSQLQPIGPIKLSVASGSFFRFVNNTWQLSVWDVGQQLLQSGASLEVVGNTFECTCNPALMLGLSEAKELLESNHCNDKLCGQPVPMSILTNCNDPTKLQAACQAALSPDTSTPGSKVITPSKTTTSPRSGKPPSSGASMATAITISMTTALLLTVPVAAALPL